MNKKLLSFCFFAIMIFSLTAKADYIKIDYGISSLGDSVKSHAGSSVTTDTDDEGYFFSMGVDVFDNIGVEGIYYDLGGTSVKGSKGHIATFNKSDYQFSSAGTVKNDTTGYGIGVYASNGNTQGLWTFSASARFGIHVWDRSGSTSIITDPSSTLKNEFFNDGTDLYFGIDLDTGLTENVSLNLTFTSLGFADEGLSISDSATLIGLGLKVAF